MTNSNTYKYMMFNYETIFTFYNIFFQRGGTVKMCYTYSTFFLFQSAKLLYFKIKFVRNIFKCFDCGTKINFVKKKHL